MINSKNNIPADEATFQKNASAYYNSYRYGSLKKLTGEFTIFKILSFFFWLKCTRGHFFLNIWYP